LIEEIRQEEHVTQDTSSIRVVSNWFAKVEELIQVSDAEAE